MTASCLWVWTKARHCDIDWFVVKSWWGISEQCGGGRGLNCQNILTRSVHWPIQLLPQDQSAAGTSFLLSIEMTTEKALYSGGFCMRPLGSCSEIFISPWCIFRIVQQDPICESSLNLKHCEGYARKRIFFVCLFVWRDTHIVCR